MIDIRGLYKSFEDKTVLSDINASFENGKTNLIIGPVSYTHLTLPTNSLV